MIPTALVKSQGRECPKTKIGGKQKRNPLQVIALTEGSGGLVDIDQEVVTLRGPFGTTRVPARPIPGAPIFD